MNKLILREFNLEYVLYEYQPEGRGECGEVIYCFDDKMAQIVKRAGENSAWHDDKAVLKVEEFVDKKNLPMEFIQAWY